MIPGRGPLDPASHDSALSQQGFSPAAHPSPLPRSGKSQVVLLGGASRPSGLVSWLRTSTLCCEMEQLQKQPAPEGGRGWISIFAFSNILLVRMEEKNSQIFYLPNNQECEKEPRGAGAKKQRSGLLRARCGERRKGGPDGQEAHLMIRTNDGSSHLDSALLHASGAGGHRPARGKEKSTPTLYSEPWWPLAPDS